jgi:hypothetical protein
LSITVGDQKKNVRDDEFDRSSLAERILSINTYTPRVAPVMRTFWPDNENNWGAGTDGEGFMRGKMRSGRTYGRARIRKD